jgi:hypothetical protein
MRAGCCLQIETTPGVFLRIQHLFALNTFSKGDKGAIVRLSTADLNPFDRDRKGSNINRARAQG